MCSPSAGPSCIICCIVFHSHPDRNEFWLRRDFTRRRIYFYILCHCSGKISPPFRQTKPGEMAKNGFALNKSVTKEPHSSLKSSSCRSKLRSCSAAHLVHIFADNVTIEQQRWVQTSPTQIEESNGEKKKHFVIPVLPQMPPAPSSLSGISSEKRAVCCSQQVSADANETCKTTQNAPLSLLSADKGSKVRKLRR